MIKEENNKLLIDNKTIMIQGTASDVGKSMVATALCRIFARNNFKVAPFKSWNMSLNSAVTAEGGEIGIAQVIQAEAAGVEPVVDMQPILVKPKGNGLSQVIVRGKPIGEMGQQKDSKYMRMALKNIELALNKLRENNDIVVMEGAGSPVEINVKDWDLANMKVAALFKSPVILVTDVARGGALAALVGTLRLMEKEERELVKGLIINRFRGDFDLLKPGLDFLEEYTGKPVLGVIPYLKDIRLPEEDSASLQLQGGKSTEQRDLKIGIIQLPHMSNFTDFSPLSLAKDVSLTYVSTPLQVRGLDLIIIPGTKSTTSDLEYIKNKGLAQEIQFSARKGVPVIGICGGYQIMGQFLYDPYHTEGEREEIRGLGLLPIKTHFLVEKTTHQVKAISRGGPLLLQGLEGKEMTAYEIHMGESSYTEQGNKSFIFNIFSRSDKCVKIEDGSLSENRLHFGTYLHGLFNNDILRNTLLNNLRLRKGLAPIKRSLSYQKGLIADYDQLADIVEGSLDMDLIYSMGSKKYI